MSLTIAPLLLVAVPIHTVGVSLAVPIPVIRMLFAPLPGALPAFLGVYRITGQLAAAIVASPLPLTLRLTADNLIRMRSRRLEPLLTISAATREHRAVPPA